MRMLAAAMAALALVIGGLSQPATTSATSTTKVVIIVGPTEGTTSAYRTDANLFYTTALKYTSNVLRIYSPNATWAAVSQAMQGASVVVYLGHGSGTPTPTSTTLDPTHQDGFGLNATANAGDSNALYYGESYIRNYIHLAPHAIVIFNHACYAAGNSAGSVDTLSVAEKRIDNYASGFLAAGADAVLATDYYNAHHYIDYLFGPSQSLDSMFHHAYDYQGHVTTYASTRTPGTTNEADPTSTSTGPLFYHSIAGNLGTLTSTVAGGAADTKAPTLAAPQPLLYGRTTAGDTSIPVQSRWSASDASGIASYVVERSTAGGAWASVSLPSVGSTSINQRLTFGTTYRYVVKATDRAGNTSGWSYGASFKPLLTDQTSSAIGWAGWWSTSAASSGLGGSLRSTTAAGASASYTFVGSSIAWIATTGPTRGAAKVYVDGAYKATVNLNAAAASWKQVVYWFNWTANGTHTIKVVGLGTAGHPSVDVDAFVRLYRT